MSAGHPVALLIGPFDLVVGVGHCHRRVVGYTDAPVTDGRPPTRLGP
jgi:hypothetical protein